MEKPFAITLDVGSSRANKTGAWRTERPVYISGTPPCSLACPAGEHIQRWLYEAESGETESGAAADGAASGGDAESGYERAWRQIMVDNPFPAIMGRVCYHPCETACNRAQLDQAVGINSVERFLGDAALERGWTMDAPTHASGRRVLVVGAGPCGLAAAYHLVRLGHDVTIADAEPSAGGMMRYGIPTYRLPRDVLDAEVARITDLGVTIEHRRVTAVLDELGDDGADAVFLAVGAQLGRRAYVPAGDAARVLDAVSVLHDMEGGDRPQLGRHVVVYGGGNTALDVARTARRLGAADAVVVYRRTRERMPASDMEVTEALEEGVRMQWLSTIQHADGGHVQIERMELDASGFPQPTGQFEELDADSVVLALGQEADLSLLDGVPGVSVIDGLVDVDATMMTGHPGLFAGGDMVAAERTVTAGIGSGRRAAESIDAWLAARPAQRESTSETADFDTLNTWYYTDAAPARRPQLDLVRRTSTFEEVTGGLTADNALYEARRCLSCGNCFECDNCYGVCPDNAVIKLGGGQRYEIDLDYCKGCGMCVEECPSGAIRMEPEQI